MESVSAVLSLPLLTFTIFPVGDDITNNIEMKTQHSRDGAASQDQARMLFSRIEESETDAHLTITSRSCYLSSHHAATCFLSI